MDTFKLRYLPLPIRRGPQIKWQVVDLAYPEDTPMHFPAWGGRQELFRTEQDAQTEAKRLERARTGYDKPNRKGNR